jgi:imidazolonepropionase-like amidohydrolase
MPHALQALVDQVGMTPQQALQAATSVAAKAVGRNSKGRIAAGADADVLVVQGDALADITAVTNVSAVFKGGVRVR